ncbi:MAG: ABC transporter permease [Verrucomicrobiota bacterium]|jgi:ABC-2 type transport system permease protein|nr:ABC transporter permease [Verrucomicrobiota bacterium]
MQAYLTLTRRELGSYFVSLTGYIIITAALFLLGFSFVDLLKQLQREPTPMPVTEMFYMTWFFWLILLVTTPVITMRLFALEKFTGTFETLMTAPVTDLQVVLAKFTAGMIFYLVMWMPLLGCVLLVRHFTSDPGAVDAGVLASTFLGIGLLGSLFISLGCFASAMTRSQVTAAVISLVFGSSLFLLAYMADQAQHQADWQSQVLACFNFFESMHDFARGVIDTRSVVLMCSLSLFFLFLTLRVVESRRWK